MATKKSGGSSKNLRDSQPKYLGTKLHDGEMAKVGNIIVRQRGTVILAGKNVKIGKDHTLYAMKNGRVKFTKTRKVNFNSATVVRSVANVI
jgi:large subunit ribosomal protein L27